MLLRLYANWYCSPSASRGFWGVYQGRNSRVHLFLRPIEEDLVAEGLVPGSVESSDPWRDRALLRLGR
jgi:hypothetical protein